MELNAQMDTLGWVAVLSIIAGFFIAVIAEQFLPPKSQCPWCYTVSRKSTCPKCRL